MNALKLLFILSLCLVAGCSTVPRGFPPIEGVGNLDRIDLFFYRGAQPTGLGIQSLKNMGVRTIVNLRMANDVWLGEKTETQLNGMIYTNVPMNGLSRPTDDQVNEVLRIIETFPRSVFIHCEHGCDRTGTIVACFRIKHDGWTSEQALREASQYGMSKWEFGMRDYVEDFERACKGR